MTVDPLNDILGLGAEPAPAPQPPRSRRARSSPEQAAAALEQHISLKAAASGRAMEDIGGVQALRRPVTINMLATVFDMTVETVTKRLVNCPFHEQPSPGGKRRLYDFKEAVGYLIKPKMTPEQFIKTLNASHMPAEINKVFWDGQRSRIKYLIEAGEAWETADVHEMATGLTRTLKDGLSTLTESMRERAKLTDAQAEMLDAAVEDIRAQLVEKLSELADQMDTPSMVGKPLFGAPGASTEGPQPDWLEEDDA